MLIFESRLFWPKYRELLNSTGRSCPALETGLGTAVSFLHPIDGVVLPVLDLGPVL
jgi:hypothetical protein